MPGALIIDSDGGWDDAFATALLAGDTDGSIPDLRLITSVGGINDQKGGADLLGAVSRFVAAGAGAGADADSAVEVVVVVGGGKLAAEAGKRHLDASDWGVTYREDCRQLLSHFDGRGHGSTAAATAATTAPDVDTGGKDGVEEGGDSADDAACGILRAVEESRAAGTTPVTLLALGPLTNIAALVRRAPPAALASIHLVVMGGAVRVDGNAEGNAEFNFRLDIGAAQGVMHCSDWGKVSLVSLDCSCCFGYQPVPEGDLTVLQRRAREVVVAWAENGTGTTPSLASGADSFVRRRLVLAHLFAHLGAWAYDAIAAYFILSGGMPFTSEDIHLHIDHEGRSVEVEGEAVETADAAATHGQAYRGVPSSRVQFLTSLDRASYVAWLTAALGGALREEGDRGVDTPGVSTAASSVQ